MHQGDRSASVSTLMVHAVVSAVESRGMSREAFAARSGIAADQLAARDTSISIDAFKRIVESALDATDDPAFGLHCGEQTSSVVFQVLAHLVQHAATFGEAVDTIARYTELVAPGFRPCVIVQGDRASLRFSWLRGEQPTIRVMAELALTGLLRLLRQYVARPTNFVIASFAYSEPPRVEEYRRIFGGSARFDQPFTELQFPRTWLTRTQLHSNPELHRLLKLQADRQLALQRSDKLGARVQQLLAEHDPSALPSMPHVARRLGVSTRTLTRKLQSESVTFAKLIVNQRRTAAKRLLEQGVLSVHQVADAMGFADAPAFHKAFKRWTGLTPMQYTASVRRVGGGYPGSSVNLKSG